MFIQELTGHLLSHKRFFILILAILISLESNAFATESLRGKPCETLNVTREIGKSKYYCGIHDGSLVWKSGSWQAVEIYSSVSIVTPSTASLNISKIRELCAKKLFRKFSVDGSSDVEIIRSSQSLSFSTPLKFSGFRLTSDSLIYKKSDVVKSSIQCSWKNMERLIEFKPGNSAIFRFGSFVKKTNYQQLQNSNWKLLIN